jgi:hypothetical protein
MNIRNLINPLLLLNVQDNKVILTETENLTREQTLQEVIITQLPNNTIAYSTDIKLKDNTQKQRNLYNEYLHVPSPSLTKQKGENYFWLNDSDFYKVDYIDKRSDGVVIYRNENELCVVICDLKSKNPKVGDCSEKFMNDKLFLDYLLSILRTMFGQNITITTIKYVIFYLETDLGDKPSTRITKDYLQKIEVAKMGVYNETVLKIPFYATHKNHIEWSKIINHQ